VEHCKEGETLGQTHASALRNQRKMLWVIIISFLTMLVEIITGKITGSMALLADGWHMGSHVAALFLSYLVYQLARSKKFNAHFTFGSAKLYSLGGYTSAIGLTIIAIFMGYESIARFLNPVTIEFNEALMVCVIGLVVNLFSAWILNDHHLDHHSHDHHAHLHDDHSDHDHDHHHEHHSHDPHDHNHQSALAHVLADALTSVTAMVALLIGKYYGIVWVDPLIGVLGALVILKWSYSLIRNTAHELLDGKAKIAESRQLKTLLEQDGGKVVDLHVWSVGNGKIAAIASIETAALKGAQSYHARIEPEFDFAHLVIEEIKKP
jgi:cation diffusion facilitator family transporter